MRRFRLRVGLTATLLCLVCWPRWAASQPAPYSPFPTWSSGPTDYTTGVALGDVTGDGNLDLVCGSYKAKTKLYLSDGNRLSATPAWSAGRTDPTSSVVLGDVDGDGDLDLVCGNFDVSVHLYENQDGTLSSMPRWSSKAADNVWSLALGDVDNDGDLDLVTGVGEAASKLYLNRGGTWDSTHAWFSPPDDTSSLALGDVNGDGFLDLVCGNWQQPTKLYLNTGGNLSNIPAWSSPVDTVTSVALGDVDGDGDLDLVCGNYPPVASAMTRSKLYTNEGGVFRASPSWVSESNNTYAVALGDVDLDSDLDLVCANQSQPSKLYLNDGNGFASTASWSSEPMDFTRALGLGDIDGDGDLDLVIGNQLQSDRIYTNETGFLPTVPSWSSDHADLTRSVALGDVDGDGALDLVCGNDGNTKLYPYAGDHMSTSPSWMSARNRTYDVALGDVNEDGSLDLVCGNLAQPSTVYLGGPNGAWSRIPSFAIGPPDSTRSVALGDIDGDGDSDLVFGNFNQRTKLYLNEGGFSGPAWFSEYADRTFDLVLGDVDGDGTMDLVCGNHGRSRLYLNQGSILSSTASWTSGSVDSTWSVALGDIDGDGDLDLVCGNDGQSAKMYENIDGALTEIPVWSSGPSTDRVYSVSLADMDGDGDLDLVCGVFGRAAKMYENNDGRLEEWPSWSPDQTHSTWDASVGDIDADGDLDIVFGNNGQQARIYLGSRRPPIIGDTSSPKHHLPNNEAFLRFVRIDPYERNLYRVRARVFDVESDPVWVLASYQFQGVPRWESAEIRGTGLQATLSGLEQDLGPFESSPEGIEQIFYWDVSRIPIDNRSVVLQLRIVSPPRRTGPARQIPRYMSEVGRLDVRNAEIRFPVDRIDMQPVTLGDSVSAEFEIRNLGNEPLRVTSFNTPTPALSLQRTTPFDVDPSASELVTLTFSPNESGAVNDSLRISSNDPVRPQASIGWQATVLDVLVEVLPQTRPPLPLGQALTVQIIPSAGVRIERGTLYYRAVGNTEYLMTPLEAIGSNWTGTIPGGAVLETGVQYYVLVRNSGFSKTYPEAAPEEPFQLEVQPPQSLQLQVAAQPNSDTEFLAGRDITVLVQLPAGAVFVDGELHYRKGGESTRDRTTVLVPNTPLGGTLGIVPEAFVTERGVDYWVELRTSTRALRFPYRESEVAPIRVTIPNLMEPTAHPERRYRLLSVPLDFSTRAESIEDILSDDFGPYDRNRWRLFHHLCAGSVELNPTLDFRAVTSRSFWLITMEPHRVDAAGGTSTPTDADFPIFLEPKCWSQIGNPFAFGVAWSEIRKSNADLIGDPVAFDPNCAEIGDYVPCGQHPPFSTPQLLVPFEGYFIENKSSDPETLWVPPVEAPPSLLEQVQASGSPKSAPRVQTMDSWALRLQARGDKGLDGSTVLGVDPDARDGFDRFDQGKPPVAPGPWVRVSFVHEDWGTVSGLYRRDLRQTGSEGQVWDLEVRSEHKAREVTLELISAGALPGELAIRLVDQELRVSRDLLLPGGELEPYRLVSYGPERAYHLALVVGTAAYVGREEIAQPVLPVRVELDPSVPNPFNAVTRIRFGLPAPGRVTLVLYNVRGERVAVLRRDEMLPAGYHVSLWRGIDDHGRPVGSGVYFCKLDVDSTILTRRLVLLR